MKKKSLLALVLTGLLVILGSTFIEAAKPLMVQDMENMEILELAAPEGGGWAVSPWGIGCWDMGGDLFAQVIESPPGDPVYYDMWASDEPLPLVINIDIDPDLSPAELVNVPAGYCVELTFDGGQKKKVYLPHITGDDLIDGWISPDLYVAKDGSTYWDEALTQLAQSAKGKKEKKVSPKVSIISPEDGATVSGTMLDVVVKFEPKEHGLGNVRYIELGLDGFLAGEYENPANIKQGTHTFSINIKNLSLGEHFLQAFAYLAEERAEHKGISEVITFTLEPLPPVPPEEVWSDMKENLAAGNIEGALNYFSEGSKEKYREIFTLLGDRLPTLANNMQDIELIYVRGDIAKYRIHRLQYEQQITYYIYFGKDEDGYWKINSF